MLQAIRYEPRSMIENWCTIARTLQFWRCLSCSKWSPCKSQLEELVNCQAGFLRSEQQGMRVRNSLAKTTVTTSSLRGKKTTTRHKEHGHCSEKHILRTNYAPTHPRQTPLSEPTPLFMSPSGGSVNALVGAEAIIISRYSHTSHNGALIMNIMNIFQTCVWNSMSNFVASGANSR